MRRCVCVISVLAALGALAGCGGRDLSTPSTRLVGHWHADISLLNVTADAYFAPRDKDGVGVFEITGNAAGLEGSGTYRVVGEDAEGEDLSCVFAMGGGQSEDISLVVAADGKTLRVRIPTPADLAKTLGPEMSLTLGYVDDRTEP